MRIICFISFSYSSLCFLSTLFMLNSIWILCFNGKSWLLKVTGISPIDRCHKFQVETLILGEVQNLPKGVERENRIIQTIMGQLLFALDGLHSTGIVHRDIKPQNVIFSEGKESEDCITFSNEKGSLIQLKLSFLLKHGIRVSNIQNHRSWSCCRPASWHQLYS